MNKIVFDYNKEPSRDILCIDCKSFYAACEAVARGLNPMKVKLVVMSVPSDNPNERGSGLILASSPQAKAAYKISNVSRARDLPFPYPKDLLIVPPRMNMYMKMHNRINEIFREFVDDQNVSTYSVDETFLDVTGSLRYFNCDTAYELARVIQKRIHDQTGIYTTVGIGDNPLLAKLALDNEAKHNRDMKAEWRYSDVKVKVWNIPKLTDFWGIGGRTEVRLNNLNIYSIRDLAHSDYFQLKKELGVIGTQLYAHAWGIDRTFLGETYKPKSKSIGNSQILDRDYYNKDEVEIVIREMADQVATRLRKDGFKTMRVGLYVGYSLNYKDDRGRGGFSLQANISSTNDSKSIAETLLLLFNKQYDVQIVRSVGVQCTKLTRDASEQISIFDDAQSIDKNNNFNEAVDKIRKQFGFTKLVYASSMTKGGRAIARSSLVGGHAGGMGGLDDGEKTEK